MDNGPLTVAFRTFGCKVNRVESEDAAAALLGTGVRITPEEDAAVVVINTCTVTAEADRKARKAVRHALALPHAPVVVATGCLATTGAESLAALGDRVIVEAEREHVAARVTELLGVSEGRAAGPAVRSGDGFRTRAAVKVADGCDAFCAYCIVPYARGLPRSVPRADVVAGVERLVAAGVSEVVLTGINIGRYADTDGADLAALVESVARTGVSRMRISSIEPLDLNDRLLGVLATTPSICPHLHVPLQSASDAVLRAMGRSYTVDEFARRIAAARAAIPGLAVTTDVLVGFPGESDLDAQITRAAVEEAGFVRLHVFRYSEREGTAAAAMPDRVAAGVAVERAAVLRTLDARMREAHARSRLGEIVDVLVESPAEDGGASGTTGDYLNVRISPGDRRFRPGEIASVRLDDLLGDTLIGEAL